MCLKIDLKVSNLLYAKYNLNFEDKANEIELIIASYERDKNENPVVQFQIIDLILYKMTGKFL